MDLLTPGEVDKQIKVKLDVHEHNAMVKTTSIAATSVDTKFLRSSCRNAVTLAAKVLSNRYQWRRSLGIMVVSAEPVKRFQGHAAKNQNC